MSTADQWYGEYAGPDRRHCLLKRPGELELVPWNFRALRKGDVFALVGDDLCPLGFRLATSDARPRDLATAQWSDVPWSIAAVPYVSGMSHAGREALVVSADCHDMAELALAACGVTSAAGPRPEGGSMVDPEAAIAERPPGGHGLTLPTTTDRDHMTGGPGGARTVMRRR